MYFIVMNQNKTKNGMRKFNYEIFDYIIYFVKLNYYECIFILLKLYIFFLYILKYFLKLN